MATLKDLWSGMALRLYLGAALGFFGSRALHAAAITPLVEMVFPVEEGTARTGFKNAANWSEITDIAVGAIGVMVMRWDKNFGLGMTAGAAVSLTGHLIARVPAVAESIPGGI